jgi:UPF0755 protein
MFTFLEKHDLRIRKIVVTLFIIFLLPFVYNHIPIKQGKGTIYLPSSDVSTVIDILNHNGYGVSFVDKIMLYFTKAPKKGWYTIKKEAKNRFMFFDVLSKQKAKTISVKIFAGENSIELTKRLAKDLKLNAKKLLKIYKKLSIYEEADIFAGRYLVPKKADEESVIESLFQISELKLRSFGKKFYNDIHNHLEIKILLVLASIIQKETYHEEEMPIISSVIQNRLNRGMKLQMDGTLNYGEYSHIVVTSERIKTDKSYYNTYKYKGIPPAPLCTVSMAALKASYSPAKTKYIYFMLNKKGMHDFASSYEQHIENIKAFRR